MISETLQIMYWERDWEKRFRFDFSRMYQFYFKNQRSTRKNEFKNSNQEQPYHKYPYKEYLLLINY